MKYFPTIRAFLKLVSATPIEETHAQFEQNILIVFMK